MVTTTTGLATSFINFTRASMATVTNNVGNIAWAGHNLLTNSESFDASVWAKDNTGALNPVVTANYGTAPNGTQTADRIVLNKTGGLYSRIMQTVGNFSAFYTFNVWMRTTGGGTSNVGLRLNSDGVNCVVTGVWTLFSVTLTAASATQEAQILLFDNIVGNDETADILAWGAHLYRNDLGGMVYNPAQPAGFGTYYPTTPPNRIGFTESFDSRDTIIPNAWTYTNITVLANNTVAPNGLPTADLVTATSTNSAISQVFASVAGCTYTLSVYAKAGNIAVFDLGGTNQGIENYWARFDLANGTAVNISGGTIPSITSVGNGWYRCSLRKTVTAGNVNDLYTVFIGQRLATVSGNSIYLWGAQVSDSASIDPYVPVYGAAVTSSAYYAPRLDYDSVNLQPRGILIEEQRTNLLQWSSDFRDTTDAGSSRPWIYNNVTVTPNDAVAPDGTMTADRINPSSNAAIYYQLTSPASATTWTFSIWLKSATGSSFSMPYYVNGGGANPNPQTGTLGTVTTQWQRFSVQVTTASSAATVNIALGNYSTGWASGNNVHAWGAQIDSVTGGNATFPTSYIPTNGAQATRTADVASVSTQAFPYSASEGTLVASGSRFSTTGANCVIAELGDGGATNIFELYRVSGSTSGALYVASGGVGSTITVSNAFPLDTVSKIGGVYKANDFQAAANGTLGTPVTSGAVPTAASNLYIGKYGGLLTNQWNGHIRQITYIPRRLSNSELQARTV